MDGLLLINKEKGMTSRDVVDIISKKFNTKKVGHFGTLDPLATGLLLVGIGAYTKIGNFLESDTKEYECEVLVGTSTDTYDVEGNILEQKEVSIDESTIKEALEYFKKTYIQEVPIYSAVKVHGKKLYEYAREGLDVELPKKQVTIYDINLISIANNTFKFKCKVSKGTYIRSLINDISKYLKVPICMKNLNRTMQDKFSIKDSYTINDIENDNYKLLDIYDIFDIKRVEVTKDIESLVFNGNIVNLDISGMVVFTKDDKDIALYKSNDKNLEYLMFL